MNSDLEPDGSKAQSCALMAFQYTSALFTKDPKLCSLVRLRMMPIDITPCYPHGPKTILALNLSFSGRMTGGNRCLISNRN